MLDAPSRLSIAALDDEHLAVRDLPAEPTHILERFVDRLWVLVEHDAQPVPGRTSAAITENIESPSVMP